MFNYKKNLPLWVREPAYIFIKESKNIPRKMALAHAKCVFADDADLSEKKKKKIYQKRHEVVYDYLEAKYRYVFADVEGASAGVFVENAPIWLFWWQGEESMPELVSNCKKSIIHNCGTHPVILVTKDNYKQYVNLPRYILEKISDQTISLTHFSDILRVNLIAEHGGYWLDATIFCTSLIKEEIFRAPIYTGRNPGKDFYNISQWRWTGYAISGWKGNALFCYVRDLFNEYWKHEQFLVDYYLIDYMICLTYNYVWPVKKMIDNIEKNNINQTLLQNELNELYTYEKFDSILNNETWLYKLTWKQKYKLHTVDGKETIYSKWCKYVKTEMGRE